MSHTPANAPANNLADSASYRHILRWLDALRKQVLFHACSRRLLIGLSVAMVVFSICLGIDWRWELSHTTRTATLVLQIGLWTALGIWSLLPWLMPTTNREDMAAYAEQAEPEFGGRLLSSLQLVQQSSQHTSQLAQTMIHGLLCDTESRLLQFPVSSLLDRTACRTWARITAGLWAMLLVVWLFAGPIVSPLLRRAFLADATIPRATEFVAFPEQARWGVGDDVTLEFRVRGHQPDRGSLSIKWASGASRSMPLIRDDADAQVYRATIPKVTESFGYRARIHDGTSPRLTATVLPRPQLQSLRVEQKFPTYLNLDDTSLNPGEFQFLMGSRLRVYLESDQQLKEAQVELIGIDTSLLCQGAPSDTTHAFVDFTLGTEDDPRLNSLHLDSHQDGAVPERRLTDRELRWQRWTGLRVTLIDQNGMTSHDNTVFRVNVVTDQPPNLAVREPQRIEDTATTAGQIHIRGEASDDFGIQRFDLLYQINEQSEQSVELPMSTATPASGSNALSRQIDYQWSLASLMNLHEGDEVRFWLAAFDAKPDRQPVRSSLRKVMVVSAAEKRAQLLRRALDQLQNLQTISAGEQRLNEELGRLLQEF